MKSPKFVGWAAVSSGAQAGDEKVSLADQICANLLSCRRHNGTMVCQLIVPGESRSIVKYDDAARTVLGYRMVESFENVEDDRLLIEIERHLKQLNGRNERLFVYDELERLIRSGKFDVLAFRNLGRIGRNAALSMTTLSMCHDADIIAYSTAAPPQSLNDTGDSYHRNLIDAITAVGYENEVREIKKRHETGMMRRVKRGLFSGITPWGWIEIRNEKGRITGYEIDEEAATVIRSLVRLYLDDGLSERATADELNKRGYTTATGLQWDKSTVRGILLKAFRYAGVNEINKLNSRRPYIKADGIWPAIIELKDAYAIEEERRSRAPHRRTVAFTHRFSRMVYCYVCGNLMHQHNITNTWTTVSGEERSGTYTQFRCMEHGAVSAKKIERGIRIATKDVQNILKKQNYYESAEIDTSAIEEEITGIYALIDRTKAGIERADNDYYVNGTIDADRHRAITKAANDRIEQLLSSISELQDEKRQEEELSKRNERAQEVAEHGITMLEHPNIKRSNAWLRTHFAVYAVSGKVHLTKII